MLDRVFGTAVDRGGREMPQACGLRGETVSFGYLRQLAWPFRRPAGGARVRR